MYLFPFANNMLHNHKSNSTFLNSVAWQLSALATGRVKYRQHILTLILAITASQSVLRHK